MHKVLLSEKSTPVFPDKCVVCRESVNEGSSKVKVLVDMREDYNLWWFMKVDIIVVKYLAKLFELNHGSVDVPVHPHCAGNIGKRQKAKRYTVAAAVLSLILIAILSPVMQFGYAIDILLIFVTVITTVGLSMFWDTLIKPDPIMVIRTNRGMEYQFYDWLSANEFAIANGAKTLPEENVYG